MQLPFATRYGEIVRYDRGRGIAAALDWRVYPDRRAMTECATAEACAQAIAAGALPDRRAAAHLAGYGLALAARAWADRPTETIRAAVIQAGEWLRQAQPSDHRLVEMVEQGLARADAAILAGGDAEQTLLDYVDSSIARADKIAERCGRIAAGLLDERDVVLTHGFAGPALVWMLALAHNEEHKQIRLAISAPDDKPDRARFTAALAAEVGVPAELNDAAPDQPNTREPPGSIVFLGADRIALDGGVIGAAGAAALAALARQRSIPCYILGYDGPDPSYRTTRELAAPGPSQPAERALIAADQISAIITNRGIYRPEMIARYLGEGDAPLDVIALSPG